MTQQVDGASPDGDRAVVNGAAELGFLASPASPLLLSPAFATAEARRSKPFTDHDLLGAVHFTYRALPSGVAAVHSPMRDRVNRLDVIRTATGVHMASMMDVLSRGSIQRLKNETMNLPQLPVDPDVPIAITVFGRRPNPAFPLDLQTGIQADECGFREHHRSIQIPGFASSEGSACESAVPEGNAP